MKGPAADKGKKQKVVEREDDNSSDHVDGDLLVSIEKLQEIQDQIEKWSEEASDEVLVVEQKYSEIRKPVYEKRNEIIQLIPDFWLTAFLSHPALCELLSEDDQKVFKYLTSMEVEEAKDVKSGYSIIFNFTPNPFFENIKLTKTFVFHDEGTTNITSTPVRWKEGMNIPNATEVMKGKKRNLPEQSFFSWFSETNENDVDDTFDEVAEIIKEDLWPNPLNYFHNDADEDESEEEEEDYNDEDNDEGKEYDSDGDEDGSDEVDRKN